MDVGAFSGRRIRAKEHSSALAEVDPAQSSPRIAHATRRLILTSCVKLASHCRRVSLSQFEFRFPRAIGARAGVGLM